MKRIVKIVVVILSLSSLQIAQAQDKSKEAMPVPKWEIAGFNNPENVLFDEKNNILYVSNVNGNPTDKDGNGYISKVSVDGKVIERIWAKGFDAPKGKAFYNGKMYVADIDRVVVIDAQSGEIVSTHNAPGATFLNDIAIDNKGNVYITNTFGFSGIYKLANNQVSLWLKSEKLNMPNGIIIEDDAIVVSGWGEGFDPATFATKVGGKLLKVELKDQSIKDISVPIGNLDGLVAIAGGYLTSDWYAGKVFKFSSKTKKADEILDLPQGSADFDFDKKSSTVFIPLMNDNKLAAYVIK